MLRVIDVKIKSGSIMPAEGNGLSVTGGPQRGLNLSSMHSELELLTLDSCRAGASVGEREENLTDSGARNSGNFQPYRCDCPFSCAPHLGKMVMGCRTMHAHVNAGRDRHADHYKCVSFAAIVRPWHPFTLQRLRKGMASQN
jgi:hypothetical protein